MRCLYCGKELALLKRLTGGGEFCSDTHKRSYQEEYNRLAVSRLLQAQTRADLHTKAGGQAGTVADQLEPAPPQAPRVTANPDPEREALPVAEVRQPDAVLEAPRPRQLDEPEPSLESPEISAAHEPGPEPEILPVTAAPEPELLSASGMSGFLLDLPAIRDFEPYGLNAGVPLEWPQNAHIPPFPTPSPGPAPELPEAGLVGYDVRLEAIGSEQPRMGAAIAVKEFDSAGLSMNLPTKPYPLTGFGSPEAIPVAVYFKNAAPQPDQQLAEVAAPRFDPAFQETARLEFGVAGIAFPPEEAEVLVPEGDNHVAPALDMDGSPRSALEALARLKDQVNGDSSRNGATENGGDSRDKDTESMMDGPASEWLFDKAGKTLGDGLKPEPAGGSEREEVFASVAVSPATMLSTPQTAELVGVAAVSSSATAVSELMPEPVKVAEKVPEASRFVVVPVKIFAPAKARLAPGSQALVAKPEPHLPRPDALPLRPKVAIGTAKDVASKVEEAKPQASAANSDSAVITPVEGDLPFQTSPNPAAPVVRKSVAPFTARPDRPVKTTVLGTDPVTFDAAKRPAPIASQKAPPKETAPAPETHQPSAKSGPAAKQSQSPAETLDPEIPIPGISFASGTSNSFWGALPAFVKILIILAVIVGIGAVVYVTSFSQKSAPAGRNSVSVMMGEEGWITDWAGDSTGLHRGRQITIYRPSLKLSDYRIEFQGRVENASIGWVFRAVDSANYYVMKLTRTSSGFKLVKYAVINGQEHEQGSVAAAPSASGWFAIRVDVLGPKFNTVIDGQAVDVWTDDQLKTGGVGFLNDRGERADIKGISISYLAGPGK